MTPDQITICNALNTVTYLPGSWDKRFADTVHAIATNHPDWDLSQKQDEWIYRLLYKYRRQVPEVYERFRDHPNCALKPERRRGAIVMTKSGKTGEIYYNEQTAATKKVIVHTKEGKLLCDPKQITLLGYFD